jgi:hypothetical protein
MVDYVLLALCVPVLGVLWMLYVEFLRNPR